MNTIDYLFDPDLAGIYWPVLLAGLATAIICATLSVVVVLKRLVFIGQGVSHAAFGGVGIAYVLGITGVGSITQELGFAAIVLIFCIASALAIARYGDRDRADSTIGIVLVAAMALGFILLEIAGRSAAAGGRPSPPGIESVLFGSFTSVGWGSAGISWIVAVLVVLAWWLTRRGVIFWAFDEQGAEAFGLRTGLLRSLVMVLLALAIVTTMRLAGVILATALLVLPGAIALRLSTRYTVVALLCYISAALGVIGGLILSFEADLQTGPSVVGVLLVMLIVTSAARRVIGS